MFGLICDFGGSSKWKIVVRYLMSSVVFWGVLVTYIYFQVFDESLVNILMEKRLKGNINMIILYVLVSTFNYSKCLTNSSLHNFM